MRMLEAWRVIKQEHKTPGYLVSFERAGDGFLRCDYFPDVQAGEPAIETENEAWELARRFAMGGPGKYVNVYVTTANFVPVPGYQDRLIRNR